MKRMLLLLGALTACAAPRPPRAAPEPLPPAGHPEIAVRTPALRPVSSVTVPAEPEPPPVELPAVLASASGEATYYADMFEGRRTASGVVFSNDAMYAAHRTYPFGTVVRVTNLANGRDVVLTVVDRGPHGTSARARRTIIDVSRSAARQLDFVRAGRTPVRVDVLEWGH